MWRVRPAVRRCAVGQTRETRRHHPPRDARCATLTVRACPGVLAQPQGLAGALPATLRVHLVHLREGRRTGLRKLRDRVESYRFAQADRAAAARHEDQQM